MKFTQKDLDWAVENGIISHEVRDSLVAALETRYEGAASLTLANVLYYLGGLIVIGAMTFYVSEAWDALGGVGHFIVALGYAAVFLTAGKWLRDSKGQRIPGGILATAAVCMTPMAVYGFQEITGWWVMERPGSYNDFYHWIKSSWFSMEIATVAVGVLVLRWFRFPFIMLPVAFSLWFMSMDLTAVIYGPAFSWDERKVVSVFFGLVMLIASFIVDRRTREDYAFWGYLFGMLAFWGGLTALDSDSELSKFMYCCINIALMGISVLLQRRVFIVFGSMGVAIYLSHLASSVFRDELSFAFALSLTGLAVIGLGLLYHKHEKALEQKLTSILPEIIKNILPQNR